jgi:Integrase core domain
LRERAKIKTNPERHGKRPLGLRRRCPNRPSAWAEDKLRVGTKIEPSPPNRLPVTPLFRPESATLNSCEQCLHPTAEWLARQLTKACGWDGTPEYLVRDHDAVYGKIFIRRLRARGIRDRPIAPRSPWHNGHAERLIGSLRRECLDHVVVYSERHLRQLLLLQFCENASISGQGYAGTAAHSGQWANLCEPNSRRITSSVRSDLIYGRDSL